MFVVFIGLIIEIAPIGCLERRTRRSFGARPREQASTRSYLQIVFRTEHVRVSAADASERHRNKDCSLRLLPAVIANLQGHPGGRAGGAQLRERRAGTRGCSVAREAGVTTRQPFRVRPGRGASRSQRGPGSPLTPLAPPRSPQPPRTPLLIAWASWQRALDHFFESYSLSTA